MADKKVRKTMTTTKRVAGRQAKADRKNEYIEALPNLNLLEMLVLAMVQSGLTATYDLVSHAKLSVGNTAPVLKRLEEAGLLTQSSGARRRTDYALTPIGEQVFSRSLEAGRADYWGLGGPSTYDSACRAIYLLWSYYGPAEAAKCVDFAIAELRRQAEGRRREATELQDSLLHASTAQVLAARRTLGATLYWFVKSTMDATLFDIQSKTLGSVSSMLPGIPESLRMAQFQAVTSETS